ncbi:hypothetical protein [Salinibacterium sp. ZJ70]|uniref:hypothetical protein n=1 Tax=Salinibacterium sp. ZJ70 TaxID=2708084 RepID=UPI001420E711|nr:hypothetical protein [Salinibacterium sp. ZJ70]
MHRGRSSARRRPTPSVLRLIGVALAAAVALTACTDRGAVRVDAVELDSPAWLQPTQRAVSLGALLPSDGDVPSLVVGATAEAGGPLVATVWTVGDDGGLSERALPGAAGQFWPAAAGSSSVTIIAGQAWDSGESRLRLLLSADRVTWRDVVLDDALARDYPWVSGIAVDAGNGYVVATSADGRAIGLRITDGAVRKFELPTPESGLLGASGLTVSAGRMVLVARSGPEGEPSAPKVHVSDDGGANWSAGAELDTADPMTTVAGVVAVGDGFLVTGAVADREDRGFANVPAAWWSEDGHAWSLETVPLADDGGFGAPHGVTVGFGAPIVDNGYVATVAYDAAADVSAIYTRSPGGEWVHRGTTTPTPRLGAGGLALPRPDGSVLAAVGGSSAYRWGALGVDGTWTDLEVLSVREDIAEVSSLVLGSDGVEALARMPRFETSDGSWRTYSEVFTAVVDASGTTQHGWSPSELGEMTSVVMAVNPVGDEVRVGLDFTDAGVIARSWFRASGGEDWISGAGFPQHGGFTSPGVAAAGGGWALFGGMRPNVGPGAVARAIIVTSPDGRLWTEVAGDFADDDRASAVTGVCDLPSGGMIAVGWVEAADRTTRAIAWEPDATGWWHRVAIGPLGEAPGWATGCASGDDGAVIAAYVSGRSVLAHSADGFDWAEVLRVDPGNSVGVPVEVPGGFAAPGEYSGGGTDGPAVWLSRDGREWSAVVVPSRAPGSTLAVAPLGADLIVAQSGRIGAPLLLVPDIARLIGQ